MVAKKIKEKVSEKLQIQSIYHIYGYSVVVGVIAGLGAAIFSFLLHFAEKKVFKLHGKSYDEFPSMVDKIRNVFQFHDNFYPLLLIALLPALGGLISGMITFFFCREASGTGIDSLIHAFHYKEGKIKPRVPLFKSIATIFTLSSGGSGGKEGPVSQIGAGIGVMIANLFKAGARARRTLLLTGTAAGLGAVFRAPLGGALTAAEMVYKEDLESDALIPCFISSVTAYLVYTAYAGNEKLFNIGTVSFQNLRELFFYLLLGVVCFIYGFILMKGFKDSRNFINNLKLHPIAKPAIGGLLVGLLSLFFFEISGTGHDFIQLIFHGESPAFLGHKKLEIVGAFLLLALLKTIATTLTIGSGGSAGIFGPSLFIGGMLGAAVGTLAGYLLPGQEIHVGSYVLVGMGAFYAGIASAPLAGILMVCEMSGNYLLLPPLIIVSIFTFILSRSINFYKSQRENRFKSPAHLWSIKGKE